MGERTPRRRILSLAGDRYKQAQQICELWLRLKAGERRSGQFSDDEREELLISKLVELCTEEIVWILNDDPAGRVLCGIWLIVDYKHSKAGWIGDAGVLRAGVSQALHTKLKDEHADIVSLIKTNIARELAERRDEKVRWLRSLKAKVLLPELLGLIQHNQHYNVAIFVDHLTGTQRSDLTALLHDQINDKAVIYVRMDRQPEEPRMWLFWYLHHSDLCTPEKKSKMGGIPRDLIAIRRGAVRTNRRGEIVMPLGPMYAKVFEALKREMNKSRMLPKNPGVNKIAEVLQADHSSVTRWLKEDLPLKLEPDGNGGVHYTFNLSTIQRCIEITAGKKRGPRTKNK